jgi:hypothetical protein
MLLRIGSRVRYQPEKVRGMASDPGHRQELLSWRGVIIGWVGRIEAVVAVDGQRPMTAFLDHLEPD